MLVLVQKFGFSPKILLSYKYYYQNTFWCLKMIRAGIVNLKKRTSTMPYKDNIFEIL